MVIATSALEASHAADPLVEAGAALAAVYHHHESLLSDVHAPLVIVCGGVTASIAQIRDWKQASTIIRPT